MITKARAEEWCRVLEREERVIDKLRRQVADHRRELKHAPPDERRVAAAELAELDRQLDASDAEIEQARRELAAARADAGI